MFFEAFEEVAAFWGQNGTTHEINSSERVNFSLSDGAKQNSVSSFRVMIFCIFFYFFAFLHFSKNEILS